MPRPKKLPGAAADPRNGAALVLVQGGGPAAVPAAPAGLDGPELATWETYWSGALAGLVQPADVHIVERWVDALGRYRLATENADADPIVRGSQGQPVESPWWAIAGRALTTAQACEAQLGLGPLARMKLGVQVGEARKSLRDINAELSGGAGDAGPDPREADPRLADG